jgi:glycine/D-amino acid oxidase-like deaminating enzyme
MVRQEPPSQAEAIIVGGGCMGASAAFHMARRGVRVVLVEKGHIASGATGHSGAIVRQHYESRVGVRLARESLRFFQRFERETGGSCDFRTTGFLSGTRERDLQAFEGLFELLQSEGIGVRKLTPQEAKEVEPQLEVSDYATVVHDPDAGYADPVATANGFASAAERDGAMLLEDTMARGLVSRKGRVGGVRLRGGRAIASERVLLAAGNWTPALAAEVGLRLPIRFVRGNVAILRRPAGFGDPPKIHFDFYHNTYSRPEAEKDILVGYMDTDPRRTVRRHELADDSVPAAIVRDLRSRLAGRFPAMARGQPRGGWAGVYDVTPDSYPIVDQMALEGLFVAAGFSGHGFKLSPEIGRLLAELMTTGSKPEGLRPLRGSRFREGAPIRKDAPFPNRGAPRLP